MSRDFFLLNRCYQVVKLCTGPGAAVPLPPRAERTKLPKKLADFYALLDRIFEIASNADAGGGNVGDENTGGERGQVQLAQTQRHDLEAFERQVVALRFAEDSVVKQPAVAVIRAIFADASYFSGLKPLPQYTEAFAYELLFPSWLNLLHACMLPRAENGQPRLEGKRQGALFEFLANTAVLDERSSMLLTGYLTFVASRFDAPHCEDLLQRLVDLVVQRGTAAVTALESIDSSCKNAVEFRQRLADFVIVEFSLVQWTTPPAHAIAYKRPARRAIPACLASRLQELQEHRDWHDYFELAGPLRSLIESPYALSADFSALLNDAPRRLGPVLSLLAWTGPEGKQIVLSCEAQDCIAALVRHQPELLTKQFAGLEAFAKRMAARLGGLDEAAVAFFRRLLVDDQRGRQTLLSSCLEPARQNALVEQLLTRAAKTEDQQRFLHLLACVCVVSPRADVAAAQTTLQAIQAVIANRSIGQNELRDLVQDLQDNYQESINYLASPLSATLGKGPRLATLYLTLNEMSQKLAVSGTVDNFSVLRAKYTQLTNMNFD